MATNTEIPSLDGSTQIPAYVVEPEATPRGAIIVIQEIFGVNQGIMAKAGDWAAQGYLAIAPDVFWRQQPGVELDPDVPEQFQQGVALMMKHDFTAGLEDVKAVIAWARAQGAAKVGLVGFCMGGRIAFMSATGTDLDAAVGYYGVGIDQMLGQADAIAGQVLLHIPTADHFVPAEAQQAIHAGLDGNPHVTLFDYEGLDHGFADTFGARRDEAGAKLADERTRGFFGKIVG
jgi:carboxymethylenebutenolidase